MDCGAPVAANPVTGPIDVVRDGVTGVLSDDLRAAALAALAVDPAAAGPTHCWARARERSSASCACGFLPRARSESAISNHAADCVRSSPTAMDSALRAMFSACR